MPITQCPECNGQVSTSADECPHCGSTAHKPWWRANITCGGCIIGGLLLFCAFPCGLNLAMERIDETREELGLDDEVVARSEEKETPKRVERKKPREAYERPNIDFSVVLKEKLGTVVQDRRALTVRIHEDELPSREELEELALYLWDDRGHRHRDQLVVWVYMPGREIGAGACVTIELDSGGLKEYSKIASFCEVE